MASQWVGYDAKSHVPVWTTVHAAELYDYTRDPHETTNVAADPAYAAVAAELRAQLHQLVPNATRQHPAKR